MKEIRLLKRKQNCHLTIRFTMVLIVFVFMSFTCFSQIGQNLIDTNATAATVRVWNFLKSNYGHKMLTAVGTGENDEAHDKIYSCTGQYAAIYEKDMNSWYSVRGDAMWTQVWNNYIQGIKTAYARGQIITVQWHWQGPHNLNNGIYAPGEQGIGMGAWSSLTDDQWNDIVTPGTDLYNKMIDDIDYHVNNYLKKLVDKDGQPIPVIFRPLHEIDGGWFWWTCKSDPSKTVQLYKILQDRIMNYHQMHNLIWVWNNGVICDGGSWPPYESSEFTRRKAFYPGDDFCDLVGIDLYGFDPVERGTYFSTGKTYRDAWNLMKTITNTKMIAMCEGEAFPDVQKCFNDANYAPWLYCLPWWTDKYWDDATNTTRQLCTWNNIQLNNSLYVINEGPFENYTSIEDIDADENLRVVVYPNPVSYNWITVSLLGNQPVDEIDLTIYDISGKVVYKNRHFGNNEFNILVQDLNQGIYFIEAMGKDFRCTNKLIISK
jgi:mannan endo-1,4-beta-mannosidase